MPICSKSASDQGRKLVQIERQLAVFQENVAASAYSCTTRREPSLAFGFRQVVKPQLDTAALSAHRRRNTCRPRGARCADAGWVHLFSHQHVDGAAVPMAFPTADQSGCRA